MRDRIRGGYPLLGILSAALVISTALFGKNEVMGEIRLEGRSKVEKTSGVWVDNEYVGYLKELKGSKKILLLPGEHLITVRQDGYQEFSLYVTVQPGLTQVVRVVMAKAATPPMPLVNSTVKLNVNPTRAAVFVDGLYVGHVKEFEGLGRGMLVTPGAHEISIALPGYQAFETNVKPLPDQKVEIKTDLVKSSGPPAGPLVDKQTSRATQQRSSETATAQAR